MQSFCWFLSASLRDNNKFRSNTGLSFGPRQIKTMGHAWFLANSFSWLGFRPLSMAMGNTIPGGTISWHWSDWIMIFTTFMRNMGHYLLRSLHGHTGLVKQMDNSTYSFSDIQFSIIVSGTKWLFLHALVSHWWWYKNWPLGSRHHHAYALKGFRPSTSYNGAFVTFVNFIISKQCQCARLAQISRSQISEYIDIDDIDEFDIRIGQPNVMMEY